MADSHLQDSAAENEQVCVDDYPEHDYELQDEADGWRTYLCRRCGAETWDQAEGA